MFTTQHAMARAIGLAFLAVAPLAAHATTPPSTFDFYIEGGPLFDTTSLAPNYVSDNLQVIVRAFNSSNKQINVASNFTGLGATSGFLDSSDLNSSGGLFSSGIGDYLTLSFNQAVNISSVQVSGWSNGLFGLGAESGAFVAGAKTFTLGTNNDGGLVVTTFATPGATGSLFKLQATGQSAFRLAGIHATAVAPAIPEPGTYALMALGLVGIAAVSRRRQG